MNIGDTWNESEFYSDPRSGRAVRRLTTRGRINQTPTYHTNSGSRSTAEAPALEPICAHGTDWGSLPGQYSHPHPLGDPSGRWVSFTSARDGRSDVYVVDVGD